MTVTEGPSQPFLLINNHPFPTDASHEKPDAMVAMLSNVYLLSREQYSGNDLTRRFERVNRSPTKYTTPDKQREYNVPCDDRILPRNP